MGESGVAPFRYHPDPVESGSAERSEKPCELCGRVTGYRYTGPVYGPREPEVLCLECIRDGSASDRMPESTSDLDGPFTTIDGMPPGIPASVLDELLHRTPGFSGWQQERWQFHCDDAAAFLRPAGYAELQDLDDALDSIRAECREMRMPDGQVEDYLRWLRVDGDATAYLFRCLHCGTHLAYTDMS